MNDDYIRAEIFIQPVIWRQSAYDISPLFVGREFNIEPFDKALMGEEFVDNFISFLDCWSEWVLDRGPITFYYPDFNDIYYIDQYLSTLLDQYLSEYRVRHDFRRAILRGILGQVQVPRWSPISLYSLEG